MKIATAMEQSRQAKNNEKAGEWEARLLSSQAHCLFYIFEVTGRLNFDINIIHSETEKGTDFLLFASLLILDRNW